MAYPILLAYSWPALSKNLVPPLLNSDWQTCGHGGYSEKNLPYFGFRNLATLTVTLILLSLLVLLDYNTRNQKLQ